MASGRSGSSRPAAPRGRRPSAAPSGRPTPARRAAAASPDAARRTADRADSQDREIRARSRWRRSCIPSRLQADDLLRRQPDVPRHALQVLLHLVAAGQDVPLSQALVCGVGGSGRPGQRGRHFGEGRLGPGRNGRPRSSTPERHRPATAGPGGARRRPSASRRLRRGTRPVRRYRLGAATIPCVGPPSLFPFRRRPRTGDNPLTPVPIFRPERFYAPRRTRAVSTGRRPPAHADDRTRRPDPPCRQPRRGARSRR